MTEPSLDDDIATLRAYATRDDCEIGYSLTRILDALEAAWKERDEAITIKNNLCQQNTELLEDIEAVQRERDDAIKDGLVQAVRIDELTNTVRVLEDEVVKRNERIAELKQKIPIAGPPCYRCGYNGPGYYQSTTHSCIT